MALFINATTPSPWWDSQAIKVHNDDPQNTAFSTPVLDLASGPQFLEVEVGNDSGAAIANVHVQIWVMAYAPVASASLYLDSAPLEGVTGLIVPAGAGQTVDNLTIGFPSNDGGAPEWYPQSSDPQVQTYAVGGKLHCCTQANVYATAADKISDVLTQLHPDTERRHAQRNMVIEPHAAKRAMDFMMFVANPDGKFEQNAVVEIAETHPRTLQPWELEEIAIAAPQFLRLSRERFGDDTVAGLEVAFGDKRRGLPIAGRPLDNLAVEVGGACAPTLELLLGPDDPQPMRINADLPDEEFGLRVLDITQAQGGDIIGGARLILLTAPEELLGSGRGYDER